VRGKNALGVGISLHRGLLGNLEGICLPGLFEGKE